jgi:hypothetical protein
MSAVHTSCTADMASKNKALFLVLICGTGRLGVRVAHFTIDALVETFDGIGSIEHSQNGWGDIACLHNDSPFLQISVSQGLIPQNRCHSLHRVEVELAHGEIAIGQTGDNPGLKVKQSHETDSICSPNTARIVMEGQPVALFIDQTSLDRD